MEIKPLRLTGSCEIILKRIEDERGYFLRVYDENVPAGLGIDTAAWNDSVSFNKKRHTVRGLHFQLPPFEEKKIVRVSRGAIWDVIVDLRRGSVNLWAVGRLRAVGREQQMPLYPGRIRTRLLHPYGRRHSQLQDRCALRSGIGKRDPLERRNAWHYVADR